MGKERLEEEDCIVSRKGTREGVEMSSKKKESRGEEERELDKRQPGLIDVT